MSGSRWRRSPGYIQSETIPKAATVERIAEGRGQEIIVVAVAVAGEKIIFVANGVVPTNVELVLRIAALGVGTEVACG